MSEELLQTKPHKLNRYYYYKLGASTLSQLSRNKIVPARFPSALATKKPDGLIVSSSGIVKAVIEYKLPSELQTKIKIDKAIRQEIEVAKSFCKLLIVSDGQKTFWINAFTGKEVADEDGQKLKVFSAKKILSGELSKEEILNLEELLDKADEALTETNDTLAAPMLIDPSALARSIWQRIWINTGKEPEKCLYNVVELFVFKFLSDVGVLKAHNNFESVYALFLTVGSADALRHYADRCRKDIKNLFPKGEDRTTVINGTIFVNEHGDPNISQSRLFGEVIELLYNYSNEFGSFKFIQPEFKTRLYESFLRQEAGIRFLGQYFTPRNVVRAMVDMSNARYLTNGARIADPFCGVGGFILEIIAAYQHISAEFEPKNDIVKPGITFVGYDKGTDEKEDERTIILAKANMLIYFSHLLARYNTPAHLKAFSDGAFNKVFKLLRSNLGTFAEVHDDPYDLILTNPPYVTSGSNSLKRAIEDEGLSDYYTSGGRGTESLALEWIIRNLKPGGRALVIVPDGLLNQSAMLEYIKQTCFVRGIISLPVRTFFSTPKKTYILIIIRKQENRKIQTDPIFSYIVSEIGETRDAKRFFLDKNDLKDATSLFNQFDLAPNSFNTFSSRCKIISFSNFNEHHHWMVERWWTNDERLALGIENESLELSEEEFLNRIADFRKELSKFENLRKPSRKNLVYKELELSDTSIFELSIGKRVLKRDVLSEGIPVYSANVKEPFGFVKKSNILDFSQTALLWGIDGNFNWGFIPENCLFANTDHCGVLYVLHDEILPKFIYYELNATRIQYGFDRTFRASLQNVRQLVKIRVPVLPNGHFDTDEQASVVEKYEKIEKMQSMLAESISSLVDVEVNLDC